MPWSDRWEEPVIEAKCIGCWPDFVYLTNDPPIPFNKVTLRVDVVEPEDTTDWTRKDIILIFECKECGTEFNCNTTSFKVLCDSALKAGWKMKFLDIGYETTCKECNTPKDI